MTYDIINIFMLCIVWLMLNLVHDISRTYNKTNTYIQQTEKFLSPKIYGVIKNHKTLTSILNFYI